MEGEKVENLIHSLCGLWQRYLMAPISTALLFSGGVLAHHDSLRKILFAWDLKENLGSAILRSHRRLRVGRQQGYNNNKEKICL